MVAAGKLVIDISVDPLDERRRRRRTLLRIGVPLGGVVLMVAAVLAIAFYSHRANRHGALALSEDLLAALDSRIALAVSAYLDPAARAVRIAREVVKDGAMGSGRASAEALAMSALNEIPQIAIFSFADSDGNYIMVRHGKAAGGIDTKFIRNAPGPRSVTWVRRDAAGTVVAREEDPADSYDPRTRPWYIGALDTDDLFWTGVYVFFTDRKPGLTVSARYRAVDGRDFVFGADITLEALSTFLSTLEIGQRGQALIIDPAGHLIASPAGSAMLREVDGALQTARVDELGDPVVTAAWDHFRVSGYGRRVIDVGDRRYITAVAPLVTAGRDWSLLMVVPEDDFVGFVSSNNRNALAMSLGIVAVTALLAGLLVHQGLRADRGARRLLKRQRAITRQSAAFSRLAEAAGLFDPTRRQPPHALTETLADVGDARRAAVWRLVGEGRILRCEDSFDRETGGHVDGLELHAGELPHFFASLIEGEEIEAPDAAQDPRTAALHRVVMQPLASRALLAVPVRQGERTVGVVWLEDPSERTGVHDFVRAVANMVAQRLAGDDEAEPARPRETAAQPSTPRSDGVRSFTSELAKLDLDPAAMDGQVHTDVAVMVLHFTDPLAMAMRSGPRRRSVSDEIACALQEVAGRHDIPYLKILGQDVVAAAGLGAADASAPLLIAELAVAVRDRCIALFEESDRPQEFRIGIDCGAAIGGAVGTNPRVFNLWGDAVRTASAMAASALPGSVQATEAAYGRLRQAFLFRPRGSFYLPRLGEARIFVLAGRL